MDERHQEPGDGTNPQWPTTADMALWRAHGGSQHSADVETVTMPLVRFGGFLRAHERTFLGRRGGFARSEALTPERKTEIARNAARARWRL